MSIKSLQRAQRIREISLKIVNSAKASHIGSALSIADLLAVLYSEILYFNPKKPNEKSRDRFILSKGHACTALYACLADVGFFELNDLNTYGNDFSVFMNHVSHKVPGVEFSMGALGHGLPIGCGLALSAKLKRESWRTFVLMSDGELQEGSNWEAFMFCSHHKLSNITAVVDFNNLQSLTTVEKTINLEPLEQKLKSFGWRVDIVNGHNHNEINRVFSKTNSDKPNVIIAKTIKGKGVSFMENKVEWHYKNPNNNELERALNEVRRKK